MTERERWVIYPLLFLALGAALRDKLFDITSAKRIVCEQMIVVGDELAGNQQPELVHIGEVQGMKMNGRSFGAVEVDGVVRAHGIETDGVLKAETVYANNFVFRGIPFGPVFSAAPGVAPGDWLRALQQSAEAARQDALRQESARQGDAGRASADDESSSEEPEAESQPTDADSDQTPPESAVQ